MNDITNQEPPNGGQVFTINLDEKRILEIRVWIEKPSKEGKVGIAMASTRVPPPPRPFITYMVNPVDETQDFSMLVSVKDRAS